MALSVRRVVTTTDENGRSRFLIDGPSDAVLEQPGRGLVFHELWVTDGPLASNEGQADAADRAVEHHPPPGGSRFRIVEFLPDTERESDLAEQDFQRLAAADIRVAGADDPSMHRNETVDYNIILSGEIHAVTEEEEVLLRAGDVLVQRGTAHTWSNRSDSPCVFASIMISAEPLRRFAG